MTALAEPIWKANRGGQWLFLACPFWEALADGDRGGGKSLALLNCFLMHVGKGYGRDWRGPIFRLNYPDLKDMVDKSLDLIPRVFPRAKFNKSEHLWTFEDGEQLMFRHLENLRMYRQFHGHEFSFIGFEELTNWPDSEAYEAILSCSRRPNANPNVPLMVRATTNPYGLGHQWCKSRFVDGMKAFEPYGSVGRQRIRIPMPWAENTPFVSVDPDYHVRLAETISNEAQRKAWTNGSSWDIVAGGRFSGVFLESKHYIEPFNIPSNWVVDRSHDWGSSKPFATLWYAESNGEALDDGRSWPKGTLFVIHEDYGCKGALGEPNWKPNVGAECTPQEIADRVKEHEAMLISSGLIRRRPRPGPGDDPLFDTSRGQSMAAVMAAKGVIWLKPSKGPGSRVTGWQLIEQRLKAAQKWPMEEPGLFVFNTCAHLRRTLPVLPRDPKKPDDIQSDTDDHCLHGDTLVKTLSGNIPIRDLVDTDGYVMTMYGWQYFYNCRLTQRNQKLIKLIFDDGSSVSCTEDHQFFTSNGWLKAVNIIDETCYSIVNIGGPICKSMLSAQPFRSLTGRDTIFAVSTFRKMVSDCIESSGPITSVQSQKAHTSTISMRTGITTKSRTLSLCRDQDTSRCICKNVSPAKSPKQLASRRLNGMAAKQDGPGIASTLKTAREPVGWSLSRRPASIAENGTRPKGTPGFVPNTALANANKEQLQPAAECMSIKSAIPAQSYSELASMMAPIDANHVRVLQPVKLVSVENAGVHDVYCLTVPAVGHFCIESGIVVKNCADSLRLRCLAGSRGSVVRGVSL